MPTSFPRMSAVVLIACGLLPAQHTTSSFGSPTNAQQSANPSTSPKREPQQQLPTTPARAQETSATAESRKPPGLPDNPEAEAWTVLQTAAKGAKVSNRADAVRVFGLIPGNKRALQMAEKALADHQPEVREAAAQALEGMRAKGSIPKLRKALADTEPAVVLAAAHALETMHDDSAYEIYYEVLTGQRKTSKGMIASQAATFKDPKKLAMLGFEEGIGFVPFVGIGWGAYRRLSKSDASQVRAAAAKILTRDPDPESGKALADAASHDKNWVVRAAALESIAKRGEPSLLQAAELDMADDKDAVKCTAAAATLHLLDLSKPQARRRRK